MDVLAESSSAGGGGQHALAKSQAAPPHLATCQQPERSAQCDTFVADVVGFVAVSRSLQLAAAVMVKRPAAAGRLVSPTPSTRQRTAAVTTIASPFEEGQGLAR